MKRNAGHAIVVCFLDYDGVLQTDDVYEGRAESAMFGRLYADSSNERQLLMNFPHSFQI